MDSKLDAIKELYSLYGQRRDKTCLGDLWTTQVQISLCIRTVWSVPVLFSVWKVSYVNLLQVKFQFSS